MSEDRQVILAVRNASAIARRNPDAIVIDVTNHIVWQFDDAWPVTSRGEKWNRPSLRCRGVGFRYHLMMITHHGRLVTQEDLWEAMWGLESKGGPDNPRNYFHVLRARAEPLFNWLGLTIETRHGLGFSPVLAPRQQLRKAA